MAEDTRAESAAAAAPRLVISDLQFLKGGPQNKLAVQFLLSNLTPRRVVIHRAEMTYTARAPRKEIDQRRYLAPPPTYQYGVALQAHVQPSTEHSRWVIVGEAKGAEDEWAQPVSGTIHIGRENVAIQLSFPFYLQIEPEEVGLIRLVIESPRCILDATSREMLQSFYETLQSNVLRDRAIDELFHSRPPSLPWVPSMPRAASRGESWEQFRLTLRADEPRRTRAQLSDDTFLRFMTGLDIGKPKTATDDFTRVIGQRKPLPEESPKSRRALVVLFLGADPTDAARLRLGEELREIREKLQLAKLREQFDLQERMAVRPADITQALLDLEPKIVHFRGHGTAAGALCFQDQTARTQAVEPGALAALFEQFAGQVECVVLSACYSELQAKAIAQHIRFVIGMSQALGDQASIAFAVGFYQALGAGRTIVGAYKLGCAQIRLQGLPEHLTPVLVKRNRQRPGS